MSAVHITLELSPEVLDKIHILQGTTKAADIAEVVRRSLAVYDLIIEHQHEGGKLVFRHADGTEEILNVQ